MMLFLTYGAKVRIFSENQLSIPSEGSFSDMDSIYIISRLKSGDTDIPMLSRKSYTSLQVSLPQEIVATCTTILKISVEHSSLSALEVSSLKSISFSSSMAVSSTRHTARPLVKKRNSLLFIRFYLNFNFLADIIYLC